MSDEWRAPESVEDATTTGARRPAARSRQSYALRQATVLLGVLVIAAAVVALVLSWGGDDDRPAVETPVVAVRGWDSVVLVDPVARQLIVSGRDGVETAGGSTTLTGLLDIGLAGAVLIGTTGTPSIDGLGVVDLVTGRVEPLKVAHDRLVQLPGTTLLVASDTAAATGGVQLVDVARRTTTALGPLAGVDAVILPDEVRASPDGRHVAFTDLGRAMTVVLGVATGTTATVPGAVADLSTDRVATVTNRGSTVLVDLADLRGARLGTVEAPPVAGLLITGPTTAVAVVDNGAVLRLDFAEGTATETARLAPPTAPTSSSTTTTAGSAPSRPVVIDAGTVAARQRIAVTLAATVVLIDPTGVVAATIEAALPLPRLDSTHPGARCIHVVGSAVEPSLVIDAASGTALTAVPAGTLVARSADGCVTVVQALGSTGSTVVGRELELEVGDPVLAVAADGSAIVLGGPRPRVVLLAEDPAEIDLPNGGTSGTFARRDTPV